MKKIFSLCLILVLALGASSTIDAKVTHKKKARVTTQKTDRKRSQPATQKANNSETQQSTQSSSKSGSDERALQGYWSEYCSISESPITDGIEPLLEAFEFDTYSHTMKMVSLYINHKKTLYTYTYSYKDGNIYVSLSGRFYDELWFTFNPYNNTLNDVRHGKTLRKVY